MLELDLNGEVCHQWSIDAPGNVSLVDIAVTPGGMIWFCGGYRPVTGGSARYGVGRFDPDATKDGLLLHLPSAAPVLQSGLKSIVVAHDDFAVLHGYGRLAEVAEDSPAGFLATASVSAGGLVVSTQVPDAPMQGGVWPMNDGGYLLLGVGGKGTPDYDGFGEPILTRMKPDGAVGWQQMFHLPGEQVFFIDEWYFHTIQTGPESVAFAGMMETFDERLGRVPYLVMAKPEAASGFPDEN